MLFARIFCILVCEYNIYVHIFLFVITAIVVTHIYILFFILFIGVEMKTSAEIFLCQFCTSNRSLARSILDHSFLKTMSLQGGVGSSGSCSNGQGGGGGAGGAGVGSAAGPGLTWINNIVYAGGGGAGGCSCLGGTGGGGQGSSCGADSGAPGTNGLGGGGGGKCPCIPGA